ncbi:MAG: ATP-binding protein, partial [Actinomycetota bacterium]
TILLGVAGAYMVDRLGSEQRTLLDHGLRARAAIIVRDVEKEFEDVGRKDGILDEAETVAQVQDLEGRVLESTDELGDRALPGSTEGWLVVDGAEERFRLYRQDAQKPAVVIVGASLHNSDLEIAALRRTMFTTGPAALALAVLAVWFLAGAALRPVERLRAEAEAISVGIDGKRLPVPSTRDEIAALARTLNDMLGRLEQALDRERRFVDDASHELRTPLARLKTELELALRYSRTPVELEATIRSAAAEVDELTQLAEHLLLLARADRGLLATKPRSIDAAQLVTQAIEGLDRRAPDRFIEFRRGGPGRKADERVMVDADPVLLRQAVRNLVDNALKHTPAGGHVWIELEQDPFVITVADTGAGFDPDVLPRVFEPFATNGDRASSTGLGLAIVRAVAEAHGGSVDARNRDGGGAVVSIRIP